MRFAEKHRLTLDPKNVPTVFHSLIPLAETWGICYVEQLDDYEIREILFNEATEEEVSKLLSGLDDFLSRDANDLYRVWLARENALMTTEYLAFTHLGMAHMDAYTEAMIRKRKTGQ